MKKSLSHIIFILGVLLIILGSRDASAQKIDAFARISVTPREGVVRQPYNVTITVYSSTWFAEPLNFTNLQIENAFIIPFTRTVSGINYINKKKYATLTFYYLVFPYEAGSLVIPELEINTSIPPEGDYKGKPTTIRTKQQNIRIAPVPSSKEQEVWMVAKNVSVRENWSKDLQNLKVGDVVEREIVISAEGTLPSLILPLEVEEPDNVSIYPAEPELQDKRNDKDANGVRSEKYSYLLEKEGELIIPEETVLWWNPITKKVYQRTLPEQKLNIAANPDMTMMESLKDSLLAMNPGVVSEEDSETFPWLRLIFIIPVILILYFGYYLIRGLLLYIKARKKEYRQSEAWYFKQAEHALVNNNDVFINALYKWFDKTRLPTQNASISSYLKDDELKMWELTVRNSSQKGTEVDKIKLARLIKTLRNNVLNPDNDRPSLNNINPV